MKLLIAFLILGTVFSVSALANCSKERPGLLPAAEEVTNDLEKFDGALHDAKAPEPILRLVHHFEEGVLEFVKALRNGVSCRDAITEFQHFHEDIQLIYKEVSAMQNLIHEPGVLSAWNRLLPTFIRLQNRLYY